jgi:hypothetical protein
MSRTCVGGKDSKATVMSIQEYKLMLRLARKHVDEAVFIGITKRQMKELHTLVGLLNRLLNVMELEHSIHPKRIVKKT